MPTRPDDIKYGPRATVQPKHKPACIVCGAVPPGPEDLARTTRALRLAGWRYRNAGRLTFIVCPAHVQEGDW